MFRLFQPAIDSFLLVINTAQPRGVHSRTENGVLGPKVNKCKQKGPCKSLSDILSTVLFCLCDEHRQIVLSINSRGLQFLRGGLKSALQRLLFIDPSSSFVFSLRRNY